MIDAIAQLLLKGYEIVKHDPGKREDDELSRKAQPSATLLKLDD